MKPQADVLRQRLVRFRDYLKQDPANSGLICQAADLHQQLGEFAGAKQLLEAGLAHAPKDAALRSRLATLAMITGNTAEAVTRYTGLLEEGHDNPALRYNLGYALMLARRFAEARDVLVKIPENSPEAPEAPLLLVRALHHLGDLEAAIAGSERYLAAHPKSSAAAGELAMLHLDAENADVAKKWAVAATADDPDNLEGLVTLGALALLDQDAEEAARLHQHAVTRHPNSGRAWVGMGLSSMRALDLNNAVEQLQRAVKYMPNHVGTWHALAWAQLMLNNVDAAAASFEQAMQLDRNFAETHGGLAVIAVMRGRTDEANGLIKRSLGLDPLCFAGRFAQSLLLKHLGKQDAGQQVMDEIMRAPVLPDGTDLKTMLMKTLNRNGPTH